MRRRVGLGVLGLVLFLGLASARPVAAQCLEGRLVSFSLNKNTILSDGQDSILATVTVDRCNSPNLLGASLSSPGPIVFPSPGVGINPPATSTTFSIFATLLVAQPVTTTITATSVTPGGGSITNTVTLLPLSPTLTISPSTLINGTGQSATATISTGVPVFQGAGTFDISSDSNAVNFPTPVPVSTSELGLANRPSSILAPRIICWYLTAGNQPCTVGAGFFAQRDSNHSPVRYILAVAWESKTEIPV